MTNRQILRHVLALRSVREGWMKQLASNPDSVTAAQHILLVNSKIELLKNLWNFSDDSIDFPY